MFYRKKNYCTTIRRWYSRCWTLLHFEKNDTILSNSVILSTSISIAPRIHIGKNYLLMVFCWNFNWQKRNIMGTFYIKWKWFKLHLKRDTYSCFINNYNPELLKAWQAKTGLQPVYNYYKAVSYMAAYFLKSENSTSVAMKQVVQEIKLQNLSARVAIKKLKNWLIHLFVPDKCQFRKLFIFVYQNYG